jgi:hypothetical protein
MQPGNLPKRSPKRPDRQTSLSRLAALRPTKRANRTPCRPKIDNTDSSSSQVSDAGRGIFDVTGHQMHSAGCRRKPDSLNTSCTLCIQLVTQSHYPAARRGVQAQTCSGAAGFTCQPSPHPGRQESLKLTKVRTAIAAAPALAGGTCACGGAPDAAGPSHALRQPHGSTDAGSRPFDGPALGCVAGVNQRGSVSPPRENMGDQIPIVECGFLLQPIADSG